MPWEGGDVSHAVALAIVVALYLRRESPEDAVKLLAHYAAALAGETPPLQTLRSLRVRNQLGGTRGTLAHE